MSTTDENPDRKRTMMGRAVAPPPKPAEELAGKGPGTMRQDVPSWIDDDDDDAGNRTAALDLNQLGLIAGKLGMKPLTLEDDDADNGEKTVAGGIPVFDESGMPSGPFPPSKAAPRGATLEQVQSPLVSDGPGRSAAAAVAASIGAPRPVGTKPSSAAVRPGVESEKKTVSQSSPFAGELDTEAKTQAHSSPFAEAPEPKTAIAESPLLAKRPSLIDDDVKTSVAMSPLDEGGGHSGPPKSTGGFRKGSGDDEKTRVGVAPSEDRTQMARGLGDLPQSESTMLFDASALLAPRSEGPVGVVTILAGPDSGKEFFLRSESTVVGRGLDCDLVLNDPSVSRRHFRIDRRQDDYFVVDLGSGNGTKVDGARCTDKKLDDGMKITVGTSTLAFGFVGSELRAPVEEQIVVKKAGWGLRFTFALLFVGLLGAGTFYAGEKLGWWRVVTPQVSAEQMAQVEGPPAWEAPADAVREKLSKRDIDGAKASLKEVETAGASADLVKSLGQRIKTGEKQRDLVAAQRKAIDSKQYQEAIRTLKTVPTTSPYYAEADQLIDLGRTKLVESWKDEADQLAGKEQFEEAKTKLQLVLAERPDDQEAKNRITEIDDEAKELAAAKLIPPIPVAVAPTAPVVPGEPGVPTPAVPGTEPGVPVPPGTEPANPTEPGVAAVAPTVAAGDPTAPLVPGAPTEVKPDGVIPAVPDVAPKPVVPAAPVLERANFRQGYKLYGQRSFSGAVEFFEEIAKDEKYRKADRKRGSQMAASVQEFAGVYGRAEAAFRARAADAVTLLSESRKLDAQVNGTFQGDITRNLAEIYAARAGAAFQAGNMKEAADLARKAKTYLPGEPSAQFVLERITAKIDGLLADGRGAKGKKAENALKTVMGLLPSDDPRRAEAKRRLDEMVAEDAAKDDD